MTEPGGVGSDQAPSSKAWPEAVPLPLTGNAVWHVALTLDDARRASCALFLEDDERGRADRFLRREDRDRFLASHAALRIILAGVLGLNPRTLAFTTSPMGRPSLAGEAGLAGRNARLDFNLSHSGDHALVALSTTSRIGVDIEAHRPLPDALRIARAHFHPREVAALEAVGPDRETAFYGVWTAKEAFVKATGTGLSTPLSGFAVSAPPAPPALLTATDTAPAAWTLIRLAPAPRTTGAVAIEAPDAACRFARLPTDWADRPIA